MEKCQGLETIIILCEDDSVPKNVKEFVDWLMTSTKYEISCR